MTAVKTEIQKVFEHAELMFKVHISSSTIFNIDTKLITNCLLVNTEVVSLFNIIIEICLRNAPFLTKVTIMTFDKYSL